MVKVIIKLILEYGLRAKREKEKKSKAEVKFIQTVYIPLVLLLSLSDFYASATLSN